MHSLWPALSANFPCSQTAHLTIASALLKVPAGHSVQFAWFPEAYVPVWQAMHCAAPTSLICPRLQPWHSACPGLAADCPALHKVHLGLPLPFACLPGAQSVQALSPAAEVRPGRYMALWLSPSATGYPLPQRPPRTVGPEGRQKPSTLIHGGRLLS